MADNEFPDKPENNPSENTSNGFGRRNNENGNDDDKPFAGDFTKSRRKRAQSKKGRLGIFGWISVVLIAIIIGGIGSLGYLSWSFATASRDKAQEAEGLVPVHGDFAPGRPKKADVLFRIAGRKRLGDKLFPELASTWMRSRGYGGVITTRDGIITTVSGSKNGKSYRILIVSGSARGGFEAMQQGRVEGVMTLRSIQPAEADRLSAFGDMTSFDNEKVVGHDVSYVFVNSGNDVKSLNGDTLGRILSGEITDWSEISEKEAGDINIKVEDEGGDKNSGLLAKLLGDREIIDAAKSFKTPSEVVNAVNHDPDSIGFAHSDGNLSGVRSISVNERNARVFEPTDFNISTEAYPFVERILLYLGSSNGNEFLKDFANFTISAAGQDIVEKSGFGAQKLHDVAIEAPPEAPKDYASFARNAKRMNFDFRFRLGANNLDNKGIADTQRLLEYMSKQNIDQKQIALFGFADNVGARDTNIGLSQSRLEKVMANLSEVGVNPSVIRAYGDALPVGANAYEEGRIKNRRVEVWICPPPSCPLVNIVDNGAANNARATNEIPAGVRLGKPEITTGENAPKG